MRDAAPTQLTRAQIIYWSISRWAISQYNCLHFATTRRLEKINIFGADACKTRAVPRVALENYACEQKKARVCSHTHTHSGEFPTSYLVNV